MAEHRVIVLEGHGQVSTVPDTVVIQLGILTTGADLTAIQAENAVTSQKVLEAMESLGVSDIKTASYSIERNIDYMEGKEVDRGYTVSHIFEIRTHETAQAGSLIDAAVSSGANTVDFIAFESSRQDFFYQQALNLALMDAIQKSISVARSLGLTREPAPVRIVENSVPPISPVRFRAEAAGTPIVPGSLTVEASVTVEFTY